MIIAKPLKKKHLGHQDTPESGPSVSPSEVHLESISRPFRIHSNPTEKYVDDGKDKQYKSLNISGKTKRLAQVVVEAGHGMTSTEVLYVLKAFCAKMNCYPIPTDVSAELLHLYREGKIVRLKLTDRPYLYYRRYQNDKTSK